MVSVCGGNTNIILQLSFHAFYFSFYVMQLCNSILLESQKVPIFGLRLSDRMRTFSCIKGGMLTV